MVGGRLTKESTTVQQRDPDVEDAVRDDSLLRSTRQFWDANPCGVHDEYDVQRAQRYAMEPWVPALLNRIAERHRSVLEVGCGQGIDSIELCMAMRSGRYVGIDYSPKSIESAMANARRLTGEHAVAEYRVGNAEALDFDDARFDAVYSMGVLHHTANEEAAVREIHRVLEPGGTAYICLYRKPAPKVAIAKMLRAMQRGLDLIFGTDRCIYRLLRRRSTAHPLFGTMFHECFGVPYMKWYGRKAVTRLFRDFSEITLTPIGANLGRLTRSENSSALGYFWIIEAKKAAT